MACAGHKTQLLIIGTKKFRDNKLNKLQIKLKVNVAGNEIEASESYTGGLEC